MLCKYLAHHICIIRCNRLLPTSKTVISGTSTHGLIHTQPVKAPVLAGWSSTGLALKEGIGRPCSTNNAGKVVYKRLGTLPCPDCDSLIKSLDGRTQHIVVICLCQGT